MDRIEQTIQIVREQTDSVIVFTSLTGKDSILLTHYCAQAFKRVVCVYMYIVEGMEHVQRYQTYFEKYPHLEFMHVPHFSLSHHIKLGFLGMKQDKSQRTYILSDIDKMVREKTGINWSFYGSKKSDGMNRRLQLNTYPDLICYKSNKVYPLADLTNSQVHKLIDLYSLPPALKYSNGKSQSVDVKNIVFLLWLYNNYPEDLQKVFKTYPAANTLLYEYFEKN